MKRRVLYLISFLAFFFCIAIACRNAEKKTEEIALQEGAIPIIFDGHWYLKGCINDTIEGNFVFDTGADGLYFDSVYYSRIPLKFDQVAKAILPGAGESVQRVDLIMDPIKFQFGTFTQVFQNIPVLQLRPVLGRCADGIIGGYYLRDYIVEFNAEKSYIQIWTPDSLPDLTTYKSFPLTRLEGIENRAFLDLEIEVESVNIKGAFLLDLGSGGSLTITSGAAQQYKLPESLNKTVKSYSNWGGIGGKSASVYFRADTVKIGDFAIQDPILSYSLDKSGALADKKYLGLIGNDILKRFNVIIDFPKNVLYLKPNNSFAERDQMGRLGFAYVDRTDICNGFIVRALYENSHAEQAGIQLGDIITQINDKTTTSLTREALSKMIDNPSVKKISLTVERQGETINVELPLENWDL